MSAATINPAPDEPLSCRECAACCHDASDGRILVTAEDLVRWKREGKTALIDGLVPGHFGLQGLPARPNGACEHLGVPGQPNDCSIYETRSESCRALEPGSPQCLAYRRVHQRNFT